ncbi:unnamed protein product [Aphanomyces euteiches]
MTTESTAAPGMSYQWYIDVEAWTPRQGEWEKLLSLLPREEKQEVLRFRFTKDQKFALCSRLLQRKVAVESFHVPFASVSITRNDHGKPSWQACPLPTWNYNVSHHGGICAIACQPDRRIGIDVVCVELPRESVRDFFSCFELQFGPREWVYINEPSDAFEQIKRFYLLWSLKEAYTKAIGVGIVIDLQRQQFEIKPDQSIALFIDQVHAVQWHFKITQLDTKHYMAIAAEGEMMAVEWKQLDAGTLDPHQE